MMVTVINVQNVIEPAWHVKVLQIMIVSSVVSLILDTKMEELALVKKVNKIKIFF